MNCQKCGVGKGDVVDSRTQGADTWRRRRCRACGELWTTVETSDAVIQAVVADLVDAVRLIVDAQATLKQVKSRGGVG